jgi:hypothetical protein
MSHRSQSRHPKVMRRSILLSAFSTIVVSALLGGQAIAQGKVEFRNTPDGQGREFEVVVPPPKPGETVTPDAKFFPQDHQVPYEPGFIEPLTTRPKSGPIKKLGAAGWTSPPGRGYGGDQNFAVGSFSMGLSFTWE